jgi:hypothetical protein
MYAQLAAKLAVTQGTDQFSPAVSMGGSNSARWSSTMINLGGATSMTSTLQGSSDLQNWRDIGSAAAQTAIGFVSTEQKNFTDAYVRLKYTVAGAGQTVIIASDINTSQQ